MFSLKLPEVLVNWGEIATGRNGNLTWNLHGPALILDPFIFKFGASTTATEFCEWVQLLIDVDIVNHVCGFQLHALLP